MKKVLKWTAFVVGGLLALLLVAAVGLSVAGNARLHRTRDVPTEAVPIPTGAAALARGQHLVQVACEECHGEDLSGQAILDDPAIGTVYSANISGVSETHSDADLVRAIRHGVDQDGRELIIMPAEAFIHFSKEDLGAVLAYLKTVPRSGEEHPIPQLRVPGRILLALGKLDALFPAEYVDHSTPFPKMPAIGANLEYGAYLSAFCESCHGANLTGGQPPDPSSPPAPNLTSAGEVAAWNFEDFKTALRTGITPSGHNLDPEFMPWKSFGKFDDDELQAIWMYIQSLP